MHSQNSGAESSKDKASGSRLSGGGQDENSLHSEDAVVVGSCCDRLENKSSLALGSE